MKGKNTFYRSDTIRHKHWDYRSNGVYFITICTQCRKNYFGRIDNGVMNLSKVGIIVDLCINEVPYHAKDVMVSNYIVMPNHIHMLLQKSSNNEKIADACISSTDLPEQERCSKDVETLHATSTNEHDYRTLAVDVYSRISPKSGSISTIVRSLKSAASRHSNRLGLSLKWQSGFYDHIVRDLKELEMINEYITQNPVNWSKDDYYKEYEV